MLIYQPPLGAAAAEASTAAAETAEAAAAPAETTTAAPAAAGTAAARHAARDCLPSFPHHDVARRAAPRAVAPSPPTTTAQQRQYEEEEQEDQPEQRADWETAFGLPVSLGGGLRFFDRLRLRGIHVELLDDCIDAGHDASGHIARLELRDHHVTVDSTRHYIGEPLLNSACGGNPHLAFAGCDQEQDTVLALGPAYAPGLGKVSCVNADILSIE